MLLSFYIYFGERVTLSVKDLGICVKEKILIFVTVIFPKIHSLLSVPSRLNLMNIYFGICLMIVMDLRIGDLGF